MIFAILLFFFYDGLFGQAVEGFEEGAVSYVTSQSVYVKFSSTEIMSPGDTLFILKDGSPIPALTVRQISSISCVGDVIAPYQPAPGDKLLARKRNTDIQTKVEAKEPAPAGEVIPGETAPPQEAYGEEVTQRLQQISGRLSVSSYLNYSNSGGNDIQRMKYTFSLNARNLGRTALSAETYISFVQRLDRQEVNRGNLFNRLKIYSLALKYDFNEKTRLWLGRKINPRISSLGAVDGLQFERGLGGFTAGILAGTRPDYTDYGFNADLFQFGAYLSHDFRSEKGFMQSTVAFVDQENQWNTDRRFAYLQHSNALIRDLYFFGSAELDLYTMKDSSSRGTFSLTNLYLMVRYQLIRQLSISMSYSNRNNIIYYETYKNILERLLESESLQGYRLQINYRPVKYLSVGIMGNYRFRKHDPRSSRNLYGYVTYSRIPVLDIAATASFTYLESGFLTGKIYSGGLSKDLAGGRVQAGLNYRYVDYGFTSTDVPLVQNIGEASLTWRVFGKLCLSAFYEGTFEKQLTFHRVYINLTQRF